MAERTKSSRFSPVEGSGTEDEILQQEIRTDWITPLCLVGLSLISVLFIRSAQAYVGGSQWKMQIVWCGIGFSVYFVASWINYQIWMRYAHFFYALAILALLLVFSGPVLYGAQRWIDFGLFKFQPSEIAKWATLVMGASILARSKVGDLRDSLRGIVRLALCFSLPMFLIFLQPDLGSTLVFPPIAFSLLYVTRIPTRFFIATFALFVVIIGVLGWDVFRYYQYKSENPRPSEATIAYEEMSLVPLKDYQRKRILTFIAPEVEDPHGVGANWNRIQALIAVATG
ncbi:MAG TPA: cell cycle protein, partial [Opitutae bacterium]|nr:cell cycle protein [Opitutae bacterium]